MKTLRKYGWLVVLFLTPIIGWGQKLTINVDAAQFRATDAENYLEVYYNVYPQEWTFLADQTGDSVAAVVLDLRLLQDQRLVDQKRWKITHNKTREPLEPTGKVDQLRYQVQSGSYQLFLRVIDFNDQTRADSVKLDVKKTRFLPDSISISDIQLARVIQANAPELNQDFHKHSLNIFPNPPAVYIDTNPVLFAYVELYNIANRISATSYYVNYWVSSATGGPVTGQGDHFKKRLVKKGAAIEVVTLNLAALSSGTYYFNFAICDTSKMMVINQAKKFFMFNPTADAQNREALMADQNEPKVLYEALDSTQVDQEIEYLRYIVNRETMKIGKSLTNTKSRRAFLAQVWREFDPNEKTIQNEFRDEYLQRIRRANEQYGAMNIPGWLTDRGRIVVMYGEPSDIERHQDTTTMRSYQIWSYDNLQGGSQFVFIDFSGFRNYTLVHSDLRGEIKNFDWQSMLELTSPVPSY